MPEILEVRAAPGRIDDHCGEAGPAALGGDACEERRRECPRLGPAPEMVNECAAAAVDDDRLEAGALDEPHTRGLGARSQNGLRAACEQSDPSSRLRGGAGAGAARGRLTRRYVVSGKS